MGESAKPSSSAAAMVAWVHHIMMRVLTGGGRAPTEPWYVGRCFKDSCKTKACDKKQPNQDRSVGRDRHTKVRAPLGKTIQDKTEKMGKSRWTNVAASLQGSFPLFLVKGEWPRTLALGLRGRLPPGEGGHPFSLKGRVEPFFLLKGGWGRLPLFPKHFASIQNNVKTFTSLHTFVFCMFLWLPQRSRVFKMFHIFCEYAFSFLAFNQYNILFIFIV